MSKVTKKNILAGIMTDTANPLELANSLVSAMSEAKSVSEQVAIKFDTLNQKVADIIQSGVEFGSTADKVFEAMLDAHEKGKPLPVTSLANYLWLGFHVQMGYTKGNGKQMVSLVRHAVAHKVRIEPGFMRLDTFLKALETKGMPALENASKLVKVKPKGNPKGKPVSAGRASRTAVHASSGLIASMEQEGFALLFRGLMNSIDPDGLSDDGLIVKVWEYLESIGKAKKNDKGKFVKA
jgi:hypothetical protein